MKQITVTKKGQGIIPRALANGEVIKFTRVCISDKDYTDVELCNLESIENVKQEVEVDNVHIINDTQVEVVCGVDNENLKDAYYIRTIGIYAEDIDGNEILYGVSVSDDIPKYMPKYEGKTLTGILYRLTINIDNAENVITDINNATVANILEVQLIEKRVSDVEKKVEKSAHNITQLSNPNLLLNTNFRRSQLVNQRGQSVYTSATRIFDMFILSKTTGTGEVELYDDYIKLSSGTSTYCAIVQYLENFEQLRGKKITFSMSAKSEIGVRASFTAVVSSGDIMKFIDIPKSSEFELYQCTIDFPLNANKGDFRLAVGSNGEIDIQYIKLEIGDIATPFVDDDPATKLAKCQYYFERIYSGKNLYFAPAFIMSGDGKSAQAHFKVSPKRINPNVSVINFTNLLTFRSATTPTKVVSVDGKVGWATGNVTIDTTLAYALAVGTPGFLRFDEAGMYIDISAEL